MEMPEPIWVLKDVVLAIHKRQIAEHGGDDGMRDQGLLDSAINRPKNVYAYSENDISLFTLAASYAHGIIKNHPFIDGNKRTAYIACMTFLHLNGFKINASLEEKYITCLHLASGELSEMNFALWLEKYSVNNKQNSSAPIA